MAQNITPTGIQPSQSVEATTQRSMPYNIQKRGDKWVVVKKTTGKVVAGQKTPLSRATALASMRARYHAEAGGKFTKTA